MRSEFSSEAELEAALRELHAPHVEQPLASEREEEVLALFDAHHASTSTRDGWQGVAWFELLGAYRFAAAAFLLLTTLAGACVMPTSYEVPLGLSLEIRAAAGTSLPVQDIAKYVQSEGEAAEVDMMVREIVAEGEQHTIMQIRLWEQSFELGELGPALRERFPELVDAQISEQALEGEVETIWARRLAHETFDLALREADLEAARAHLLMRLHAQGFEDEEVTIEVRDGDDGQREIEVRIEQHHEGELDEALLEGMGPGFDWKVDPSAPERIELPAGGEPVRVELHEVEREE